MKAWSSLVVQVGILLAVSSVLALGFNAVRRDANHVELGRNYFPEVNPPSAPDARASAAPARRAEDEAPAPPDPDEPAAKPGQSRPTRHSLQVMTYDQAWEMFEDEAYAQGLCIFIDARSEELYLEGHIPGAYRLDHYRLDQCLPDLLPVALGADRIVLYCTGGNCEDSVFAANDLLQAGVGWDNVWVYEGGIGEWVAKGGPTQTGEEP